MWRLGCGLLCCWVLNGQAEVFFAQATGVPDGDTLWVRPQNSQTPRKLRLLGVDAPEICQAGGQAARDALAALVSQQRLKVTVNYQHDYGRGLARLQVNGEDVAAKLVAAGHAWSVRWRRSLGPYAAQEAQARAQRRGVFADNQAELPSDFRKRVGSCYPARKTQVACLRASHRRCNGPGG